MKRLLLFAVLLILFPLSGCKDKIEPGTATVKRQEITGAVDTPVTYGVIPEYYETSGTIKAVATSAVAARLMATVISVPVKEGDKVHKGDLLLTLDDSDVHQKIAAAEAGYQETLHALAAAEENMVMADVTYRRFEKLYAGKALSKQELDQAATRNKVAESEHRRVLAMSKRAEAGLAEAKVVQGFTRITAPSSGIITRRNADPGDMASPGMELFLLADTSTLEIETAINERYADRIRPGLEVALEVPAQNRRLSGKITEIIPAVNPNSRAVTIKIALAETDLLPGMYVKISIPTEKREGLLLPKSVLVHRGQLSGVYVVDPQDIITYRLVRTGKELGDKVEILAGLRENERIITQGLEHAVDGGLLKRKP
jgi:RND family efflux transporter MFP subunit